MLFSLEEMFVSLGSIISSIGSSSVECLYMLKENMKARELIKTVQYKIFLFLGIFSVVINKYTRANSSPKNTFIRVASAITKYAI